MSDRPPLAVIAGPTASGKSALALALAEATGGTIVNADASQLYRDLPILSAAPSAAERARAPHLLYGTRDAADPASAAAWAADAEAAIGAVHAAGALPIVVGGTGLYVRTLLDGIAPVPAIDPAVRAAARALPVAEAHAALAREDPPAAARLRSTDTTRVARALEVVRATGRPLADWHAERVGGIGDRIRIAPLILLPPRDRLRERIAVRFEAMLAAGALEEVATLLERALDPDLPAMRAIGVPEIAAFLRGDSDRETMIARAVAATRRYAKRQTTWFAHQPPADWPRHFAQLDDNEIADLVTKLRPIMLTR